MADVSRIQELFYELRISEVMSKDVIVVSPETTMRELQDLLREHRISGTPVVDSDGELVGIVSLMDLIQALEAGRIDRPVQDCMTPDAQVLYEDEQVVWAIRRLQQTGYGRFPVVNRESGKLVGILTQGDIIKGTLKKLDIDYRRKEQEHRAEHIFEDLVSENTSIVLRYTVKARDFIHGGEASSKLKRSLKRLGVPPKILRRVAVATYEAEMNLILHATDGGTIRADVRSDQIRVDVSDHGPGIPDVEQAMRPGYSTAPNWIREMGFGAGMGLSNIQSCADEMSLDSKTSRGTHLRILFWLEQRDDNHEGVGA